MVPKPMHAIARIGLVDYYGRVFTANDPHWKQKKQENLTILAENVLLRPAPPPPPYKVLAPAGPILLNVRHKTWISILNKVTLHWRPQPGDKGGATAMPSPRSFEWARIPTTKPTYPQNLFSPRISAT